MAENTTPANGTAPEQEQDLSELLQIRRDKLTALQQEGGDPFEVTVSKTILKRSKIRTSALRVAL